MSIAKRNVDAYGRPGIIEVAAQVIFEYLSTSAVSAPVDTDVIHDVPLELSELVGRIRGEPFDRTPTRGRWGRMLLAAREVIFLFVSAGLCAAFP
eukprot:2172208-Pyramimonas_sp.AAC.1